MIELLVAFGLVGLIGFAATRGPRPLAGGRAAGRKPSDFDRAQLRRGTKVEMEHTTDPSVAREIAMDHLAEDPDYYKKLATIHTD